MPQIYELSAAELARQIRERIITPVEVVQSFFERIDSLEPVLDAWVRIDRETVLVESRKRQEEMENGAETGPLHGVPIGIKDIYNISGIPTTCGSKVYERFVPNKTAVTIDLLQKAGAVVLGKTVTTEFACLDPSHTKNPWNASHTPGGSSSGSAVSVAARMCPVAMGSQTVGSVLRPASYNGIVGLKPTYGRVSRSGVIPVSWSLDTVGWMGRSVEDMALLLQVMAGPDQQDPVASNFPVADYLSGLESSKPPCIGLITSFFMEESDAETQLQTKIMLDKFKAAGATIVELALPESFKTAFEDQLLIMSAEAASFHKPMYEKQAQDYRPKLREMLRKGLEIDAVTYSRAQERRLKFSADMRVLAEQADVLITPSTPTPSLADLTNTGDTRFQGPWTSCGLPTITLPAGLAISGLPMGIQLITSPFAEDRLLSIARWCEKLININLVPPIRYQPT